MKKSRLDIHLDKVLRACKDTISDGIGDDTTDKEKKIEHY